MSLIYSYLDTLEIEVEEKAKITDYIEFVNMRATGESQLCCFFRPYMLNLWVQANCKLWQPGLGTSYGRTPNMSSIPRLARRSTMI